MKAVSLRPLIGHALLAVLLVSSCILDPKNPPAPNDPGEPPVITLEAPDDVLELLDFSYNTRHSSEYARLLDDEFVFFFSVNDINAGNVQLSQWDRAAELGATANMFDPNYSPPNRDPISSIDLTITYPPGTETWTVIPGTADNGHPNEDWYEKTIQYLLTVKAGDTTFTSGTPIDASFVIRQVELEGKRIYRIVQWRDDI